MIPDPRLWLMGRRLAEVQRNFGRMSHASIVSGETMAQRLFQLGSLSCAISTRHAQIGHKVLHRVYWMQLVYWMYGPPILDSQLIPIMKMFGDVWHLGTADQQSSVVLLRC